MHSEWICTRLNNHLAVTILSFVNKYGSQWRRVGWVRANPSVRNCLTWNCGNQLRHWRSRKAHLSRAIFTWAFFALFRDIDSLAEYMEKTVHTWIDFYDIRIENIDGKFAWGENCVCPSFRAHRSGLGRRILAAIETEWIRASTNRSDWEKSSAKPTMRAK